MTQVFEPITADGEARARLADHFRNVDVWVFDLDNTLYPADSDLWPKIDQRITLFLAEMFGLDGLSARALQKYYYQRYGTTLKGLVEEHRLTPDEFLRFVHDIDRSSVQPNHSLAAAIGDLPGRKLILTNGSREHALATARSLGLDKAFEDVFDIVAANLVPKPEALTYETFFARHGVDPTTAAMFEDYPRNLFVPHQRGMVTTLVVPGAGQLDHRGDFKPEEAKAAHIDYVTHDLAGFLEAITRAEPLAPV